MKIKMCAFFLAASFFLASWACAQTWPSADQLIVKIQTTMNLTKEQLDKVRLIIEENMTKRKQITPQLNQGLTQAQSDPLDDELYNKLREVLTRTQMREWGKIRERIVQGSEDYHESK